MDEYNYQLEHTFTYGHNGQKVEASFIKLLPPTGKHFKYTSKLKQMLFQCIVGAEQSDTVETDASNEHEGMSGEQIQFLLWGSEKISLCEVLLVMQEMLKVNPCVALVDGEQKLTQPLIENMHPDEFEAMVGQYIAVFIGASVLSTIKKASLKKQ